MNEQIKDVISDMTTEEIVDKLFGELGMYIGPDATQLAFIATDPNERSIIAEGNKATVYNRALRYIALNKMEFLQG